MISMGFASCSHHWSRAGVQRSYKRMASLAAGRTSSWSSINGVNKSQLAALARHAGAVGSKITMVGIATGGLKAVCALQAQCNGGGARAAPFLNPLQIDEITAVIMSGYAIPLVPVSLQAVIVGEAVKGVVAQLEDDPVVTSSRFTHHFQNALDNGLTDELLDDLVLDLNGVLDIPLLTEESEESLLRAIIAAMLSDGTIAENAAQAAAFRSMSGVQGVLDPQKRLEMVQNLNKIVDIPLLSEEQEAEVIDRCLCTISDALLKVLPPAWLSVLQGSSSVEIQQLEQLVVSRVEMIIPDVLGITERKHETIAAVVHIIFEACVNGSAFEEAAMSLNPADRKKFLTQKEERLRGELELLQRSFARKVASIQRQITETVEERDGEGTCTEEWVMDGKSAGDRTIAKGAAAVRRLEGHMQTLPGGHLAPSGVTGVTSLLLCLTGCLLFVTARCIDEM